MVFDLFLDISIVLHLLAFVSIELLLNAVRYNILKMDMISSRSDDLIQCYVICKHVYIKITTRRNACK